LFTRYFLYTRQRPDRREIRDEWIERVIRQPVAESIQMDGRIRLWARIPEAGGKYLRGFCLKTGEQSIMPSFDRRFREIQ